MSERGFMACKQLKTPATKLVTWLALFVSMSLLCLIAPVGCVVHKPVETRQAIVAKSYVREKYGFDKIEVSRITPFEGYYSVWVSQIPKRSGGFVIVDVSEDGKIINEIPGR